MMIANPITVNSKVQGGTPCFAGTRVPVASLFDHLEQGVPLDEFLVDFPTVSREQAVASTMAISSSVRAVELVNQGVDPPVGRVDLPPKMTQPPAPTAAFAEGRRTILVVKK